MKLKDVDIVPDGYWTYWEVGAAHSYIAALPTVEAIPKEFIEKKIDEYLELGLNSIAKELNVILAEWEKENENIQV